MNITRHNYETFFLLYVDKELSAAERKTVEVFVQENPDLQAELLALQQTVFKADDTILEKKDWLYMEDGVSALQENLLLYADDELDAADKKTVEALLATDKTAAAEWAVIRQTKLQADASVLFDDKKSLYRHEPARVVGIKWWRVAAAAAVLLGFGLWTGVAVYNNNFITKPAGTEEEIASGTKKIAPANRNNPATKTTPEKQNAEQAKNTGTLETTKTGKAQPEESLNKGNEKNNRQPQNINREAGNMAAEMNNEKTGNNLPKPYSDNINRPERNEYAVINVTPEKNNSSASGADGVVLKATPAITDPAAVAAIPVVYTDGNDNNDRFLYMDEDKVKRTKLGGFIRKAKRMLERNANIKTGDGLKVAGFEIALK
jgi:hypothetical protein